MYEEEFKEIVNASNNNSLVFFVGAGISSLSGSPNWKNLIDILCEKINRPLKDEYSNDEYLRIPQMYYHSLDNKDEYYKTIESEISVEGLEPNRIHYEMFNLNPAGFITTNYDTLLEASAEKYCQLFKTAASDNEVPSISGEKFILKVHGDFKNKNIVLKEEDYLGYDNNFKLMVTLLKSIFSTHTVVFIGYGLNDYDIKQILCWVKDWLKEDFKKPIFFHCGNEELSNDELIYHQSKGVKVIEWQKLLQKETKPYERYESLFNSLRDCNKQDFSIKDMDEAFEKLFKLFSPLDSLRTLRHVDISKKISGYNCFIESNGIIRAWDSNPMFSRFVEIDKMKLTERNHLPLEIKSKYKTIRSVLKKANIYGIHLNNELYLFKDNDCKLADSNCILYSYEWMDEYVKKHYRRLEKQYFKAFYLYRLYRYEESLSLFTRVARRAYKENNYLIYYLAKSNCIRIKRLLDNPWFAYSKTGEEDDIINDNIKENLYNNLPSEFKEDYASLKDLHSPKLLFEYYYYANESANKVYEIIDTNTVEYGLTACDKAMFRINDFMHFTLGNGLAVDSFIEYKNSVKKIMGALLYHYTNQNKREVLIIHLLPEKKTVIEFDEIDFYCFIECFKDKEISRLFEKNQISLLAFRHMDDIEQAIKNLFSYYELAKNKGVKFAELYNLQIKIKNVLVVSRFIDLSQALVDYMTRFVLENEFRDILINDKVLFLDRQIYKQNKQSEKTISIVEQRLLAYIDEHKRAVDAGEKYDMLSAQVGITYMNLANYLMKNGQDYISEGLSNRVEKMIEDDQMQLFSGHYYKHINSELQKRVVNWIEKNIENDFSFKCLCFLISQNYRLSKKVTDKLGEYLKEEIESDNQTKSVYSVPALKKYNSLIQVGYWCHLGLVDSDDFQEFIGICDEFDFYYNPGVFSYEKFDVRWLFGMHSVALEKLAENELIRVNIRRCIVQSVQTNDFTMKDNEKLQKLLIQYFC